MIYNFKTKLIIKEQLNSNLFKFGVKSKEIADVAKPGQFLEIKVSKGVVPFLKRPISIYNIDKQNQIIEFIFQVKGDGTRLLSETNIGEEIDIMGPLGNGTFKILENKRVAILGGGIGVFPLYELAKNLKNSEVNIYLGFRNKNAVVLENEFKNICNHLTISTDDGSYGLNGFAIDELKKDIEKGQIDFIYACGPIPMLRAVKQLSLEKNIPCQVSMEERMACGLGVCLGCAVKKTEVKDDEFYYAHVCKDGPVFDVKEIEI